jgi:hypothetical protein
MITLDSLIISTTFVDMPIQGVVMYYTDTNITIIDITKLSKNTRLKSELDSYLYNYLFGLNLSSISCSFGDFLKERNKFSDYLKILSIDQIPVDQIEKLPFRKPVVSTKITRRTIRKKPLSTPT